jgi:hypothetical protein
MTKVYAIEVSNFREVLTAEAKNPVTDATFERILTLATRLDHLAQKECNQELTQRQKKMQENAQRELGFLIGSTALGVMFTFDGDPRACTVKLRTPKTKRYNTWGGAEDGWAVPTR